MASTALVFSFLLKCVFVAAQLSSSSLESHPDVLDLGFSFDPVKPAYWTNLPHHRRTPFSVSPDGKSAYLAYLDSSDTNVHVAQVDPTTFAAVGTPVTVKDGKEAGGLVAQNDGFALLTNVAVTGTDAPPSNTPVPVIVRYQNGQETWRTFVAGPGVHADFGLAMAPDMNGDLVYSESAKLYGAYFVVTDYTGNAKGHFGDSIEYVDDTGSNQTITGATSAWGCSHNTGIAFEAADEPPFASVCAEDHGSIWLNTKTQGMSGQKIAGENTTNGASGEPMGGMSGSYSALANFPGTTQYIFAWATRGCVNLTPDSWMGNGFTQCSPRTMNHNVAISLMSDKQTMTGAQAISTVGAPSGDDQLNLVTTGTIDRSNVHVATFDSSTALVTWEEIASPSCTDVAMGCSGTFTGAYYQAVDSSGKTLGDPISSNDVYVSGDIVNIGDKLCWPYVNTAWDLSKPSGYGSQGTTTTKMSFACIPNGGAGSGSASNSSSNATASAPATSAAATSAAATSAVASPSIIATDSVSTGAAVQVPSPTPISSDAAPSSTAAAVSEAVPTPEPSSSDVASAPESSSSITTPTTNESAPVPTPTPADPAPEPEPSTPTDPTPSSSSTPTETPITTITTPPVSPSASPSSGSGSGSGSDPAPPSPTQQQQAFQQILKLLEQLLALFKSSNSNGEGAEAASKVKARRHARDVGV
ncbi:MAG: hypothetical protein Q9160_000047 [Pyrenula sp. 1 TL-2023]